MLVSQQHQTLILNLRTPGKVLGAIPAARVSDQHPNIVYVPHTVDNVILLRKLGFRKTPSPVLYDYDWPGRFTPYKHQLDTVQFMVSNRRGFVFAGMGVGKTNSALWAFDYLKKQGKANKMLVVAPLSTLDPTWGDTIFADFIHLKFAILHTEAKRRLKMLNDKTIDVYVINPDGFQIIAEEWRKRPDIDVLCVDESTTYKNAQTTRFKCMLKSVTHKPPAFFWEMSGTPTPNAPYEAWPQARLMGTHQCTTFSSFRESTMQKISMFKWVPRAGCERLVHSILSPAVRFKTDDCLDLPPTIYHTREASLSEHQRKMFKEMLKTFSVEIDNGAISAVNEADKQNKLLQIICGFVYGDDGAVRIEAASRLKVLDECIEESEAKAIVFVPYIELIDILKEHIEKHWQVAVIDGRTGKSKRDEIIRTFQSQKQPHVLLAHPRTMSHGLTLTAASTIIWYAPYPSNETYEQANARIVRPSQTRTTNIIHIEATSLEKQIYARLKERQRIQGLLLDFIAKKEM